MDADLHDYYLGLLTEVHLLRGWHLAVTGNAGVTFRQLLYEEKGFNMCTLIMRYIHVTFAP